MGSDYVRKAERVTADCKGCLKATPSKACLSFIHPAYQHRNGLCFGYVDRVEEMVEVMRDCKEYEGIESNMEAMWRRSWKQWLNAIRRGGIQV